MASSSCWRCLSRPNMAAQLPLPNPMIPSLPTRSFNTSAALYADKKRMQAIMAGRKQKAATGESVRGGQKVTINKKSRPQKSGKLPEPGERKRLRKRIVLSNTNALEVEGMANLTPGMLTDARMVGRVVGLPGNVVDGLRASEAFKVNQGWGLFRHPSVLIREESVRVSELLQQADVKREMIRLAVDGDRGTGKSTILLHAMATAFLRGWIVLHIPEARDVTNATTDYVPIPRTTPTLYSQPEYTAAWLERIQKANEKVLARLQVSEQHRLPIPLQSDISLARLCELGAREPEAAWPIFKAFWVEITSKKRPPILMTLDSLSNIMRNSEYRSPEFELIHAHDLALVNHFVDYFTGVKSLPNGGAIIGATSRSQAPVSPSMELALKQIEDRQAGRELTKKDSYCRSYDARVDQAMQDLELMRLRGLSKVEARGLMDYWAASGMLRSRVDEKTVAEKWALAGNGIVGEMERGALRMRI